MQRKTQTHVKRITREQRDAMARERRKADLDSTVNQLLTFYRVVTSVVIIIHRFCRAGERAGS